MIISPEICLLKSAETSNAALVIHLGDSLVQILMHKDDKDINFQLVDFDAYKCDIDFTTQEVSNKVLLIQPLKADVKLAQDDANNVLSATVDASGLQAILSYRDIRMIQHIVDSFSPLIKTVETELEKEKAIVQAVASSLLGDSAILDSKTKASSSEPQREAGEKLVRFFLCFFLRNFFSSLTNETTELLFGYR
jgi:hypothetical protein